MKRLITLFLLLFIPLFSVQSYAQKHKKNLPDSIVCNAPNIWSANYEGNVRTFAPITFKDSFPQSYTFEVYDRWGTKLFSTTSTDQAWNGRMNNKGPSMGDGTYYWIVWWSWKNETQGHTCNGYIQCIGLNQMGGIELQDTVACDSSVYIPNAFTPNDDGVNDEFSPRFVCPPSSFEMWIYDRWGNTIYHTTDINKGWNGSVENKGGNIAQDDTYVWKVKCTFVPGGEKHSYIGHVSLIR